MDSNTPEPRAIDQSVAKSVPNYVPEPAPYQPSQDKVFDLIHTNLEVSFNWEKQYLYGLAELKLKPYFFPQNQLILDAKGFDFDFVKLRENGDLIDLSYSYTDSLHLIIDLPRTYTRTDEVNLSIKYTAKPNELEAGGSGAITSDKGLYFINPTGEDGDKPKQIWTQGETHASSCWFPTIDSPNEKTTQEISITVDTIYTTLSNGALKYSLENGDGTRTDYWVQEKKHAPYLFMMAIGEFSRVSDTWKELVVDYYVEPKYAPHAKAVFGHTPEMLEFFSNIIGYPYPWDKYSQVVVRDFVSGAMENTTASVFMEQLQLTSRETLDKNWDYIIAHELFHHWFGDLVTCESWSNLALNESFANYSEYMWLEYKYGRDEADFHRHNELSDYLDQARDKRFPIIRYNYERPDDMFDRHSYNKGGLVLHMLRKHLGDEAFYGSLQKYLKDNAYTDAEIHELRLAFEDYTGLDLKWFFDQWFMEPGHPELKVEKSITDTLTTITVRQLQDTNYAPIYKLPVMVEIWKDGSKRVEEIMIDRTHQDFSFVTEGQADWVFFDSEQQILGKTNVMNNAKDFLNQYALSERFEARYDAIIQLSGKVLEYRSLKAKTDTMTLELKDSIDLKNLSVQMPRILATFEKALHDDFYQIRKAAIESLVFYHGDWKEDFGVMIEQLAQIDSISHVRAAAVTYLNKIDTTGEVFMPVYEQGIRDSSYLVVGASLSGYFRGNAAGAKPIIKEFSNSDKINIVKSIASFFIETKDASQYEWFKTKYLQLKPIEKIHFSPQFASYIQLVYDSSSTEELMFLEEMAMTHKHLYVRFSAYKTLFYLDGIDGVRAIREKVVKAEQNPTLIKAYKRWENSLSSN